MQARNLGKHGADSLALVRSARRVYLEWIARSFARTRSYFPHTVPPMLYERQNPFGDCTERGWISNVWTCVGIAAGAGATNSQSHRAALSVSAASNSVFWGCEQGYDRGEPYGRHHQAILEHDAACRYARSSGHDVRSPSTGARRIQMTSQRRSWARTIQDWAGRVSFSRKTLRSEGEL